MTLTPEQTRVVITALDLFSRIHIGQFGTISDQFCGRLQDQTDNEQLEEVLHTARQICFPELDGPNHSYGIARCPTEKGKIAWDVQQVIRHCHAYAREPDGGMGVQFHQPLFVSKSVPRPTAKSINILDRLADV